METMKKMKYILEDVFELERKMKEYKDIKIKLKERKHDLDLAIKEYQNPNEIKLYDKVRVVKNSIENPV